MDRVRGITDQREPRPHVLARMPQREREAGPAAVELDGPSTRSLAAVTRRENSTGLERLQRFRLRRGGGPDQRHPPVAQRQQRQRPVRQEALPGRLPMRPLGAQVRHDRGLAIGPAGAADAAELARPRMAAVGTDDEGAAVATAVAQRHARGVVVELQRLEPRAQVRHLPQVRRLVQRPLHAQVLDDVAEIGLAGLGRGEMQRIPGVEPARRVPDHHVGVRARRAPRAPATRRPRAGCAPTRATAPRRAGRRDRRAAARRVRFDDRDPPRLRDARPAHEQRGEASPTMPPPITMTSKSSRLRGHAQTSRAAARRARGAECARPHRH